MTNSPLAVWSVFVSGLLVALILLAGFVALVVLSQRRYLEQHRKHARRILEAQEAERAWVSREVHDGAVQWVGNLERECEQAAVASSGPASERIMAIRSELSDLAAMLRGLAHRLHPPVLERKGLPIALTMLGREIDDSSELRVDVRTPEQPISELKPEAAVALYRIAQEALQNVMKHSGASQASVTLTATERAIELVVQDAGKGFDAGNIAKRGMGLLSMQERAVLAGGSVTVRSSEGKGTVVRASIPVAPTREG
jgi:signal transduction histidine kinase